MSAKLKISTFKIANLSNNEATLLVTTESNSVNVLIQIINQSGLFTAEKINRDAINDSKALEDLYLKIQCNAN
jgi:hypothetical protein